MRKAMQTRLNALRSGTTQLVEKGTAFVTDRGGNFAMIFGLTSFALVMAGGMALDYARLSTAKSQLNHAVDAAVLSTTRQITAGLITEEEGEERVRDFIFANIDEADIGLPVSIDQVTINQVDKTLEVIASLDVPMTLTKITGRDIRTVATGSKAQFSNTQIEVAMALDITGSMRGSKIAALKTAATNGVEKMFDAPGADDRVRIGLVPYAATVDASPVINQINYTGTSNGCVYERTGPQRYTDAFASPVHPVGGTTSNCPGAQILPMTNNETIIKNRINSFGTGGCTAGHIAIAWSYYMLSPQWNDAWPDGSDAAPYAPGTRKSAVIMTDGAFNTHPSSGNYCSWGGVALSGDYARNLCSEMKSRGITVYTIAFSAGATAAALMADCASPGTPGSTHFFNANDGNQLNAAFEAIAEDITELRLIN